MPKMVYLTRRHPSLDQAEFTRRWRAHAQLGMAQSRWSNVARYVHCDVVQPVGDEIGYLSDHDGIGMIWYKSLDHRVAHAAESSSQRRMEHDELATFARPIAQDRLLLQEQYVSRPTASAPWKLTRFFSSERMLPPPLLHALGRVISAPLPPENSRGWGLDFAEIEETWFAGRQSAIEAAHTEVSPGQVTVLSNEIELYRAPGSIW